MTFKKQKKQNYSICEQLQNVDRETELRLERNNTNLSSELLINKDW